MDKKETVELEKLLKKGLSLFSGIPDTQTSMRHDAFCVFDAALSLCKKMNVDCQQPVAGDVISMIQSVSAGHTISLGEAKQRLSACQQQPAGEGMIRKILKDDYDKFASMPALGKLFRELQSYIESLEAKLKSKEKKND